MSKKTVNKKSLAPKAPRKQAGKDYSLIQEEMAQPQRPPVSPGTGALKSHAPAATEPVTAEPKTPAKPLTTLDSLWPAGGKAGGISNGTQPPQTSTTLKTSQAAALTSQKQPAQATAQAQPAPKAAGAQVSKPAAAKSVSVRFALLRPSARQVSLCGEFNGWSPTATPMKRRNDGQWEITMALPPGHYQYKFVADGEWLADPAAQKSVGNQFGSLNSVIEVRS